MNTSIQRTVSSSQDYFYLKYLLWKPLNNGHFQATDTSEQRVPFGVQTENIQVKLPYKNLYIKSKLIVLLEYKLKIEIYYK